MKVFVYEHITGGGCLGSALPQSLLREGQLMLHALVQDLGPSAAVSVLRDSRIDLALDAVEQCVVSHPSEWQARFDESVRGSDAVWVVAPETDGVLEQLSCRVLAAGRRLLSCHPDGVGIASSKHATAQALLRARIAVVPTFRYPEIPDVHASQWVAKPDDGCSCGETRLLEPGQSLYSWVRDQTDPQHYVVQPYVEGQPASLSICVESGRAWLLSVNVQRIALEERRFRFLGCEVNALRDDDRSLQHLSQQVLDAIPALSSYFGVDFMFTANGPVVIEVNPRLTTSYAGLHAALGINVAQLVLEGRVSEAIGSVQKPGRPYDVDLVPAVQDG